MQSKLFWEVSRIRKLIHLCRCDFERGPIKAGQDVDEELQVDLNFVLRELSVFGVQRERRGRGLARLHRASEKVYAQDLHFSQEKKKEKNLLFSLSVRAMLVLESLYMKIYSPSSASGAT
jgi:hypothetical protein